MKKIMLFFGTQPRGHKDVPAGEGVLDIFREFELFPFAQQG